MASNSSPLLLPVLIIPGFMSSGLEIRKSSLKESWQGKRIWINLKSLGFEAITGGSSSRQQHDSTHSTSNINAANNDDDDDEEPLHNEYTNMWLQHMALSLEDQCTEHPQVEVRSMNGLRAVDYLTPGALTNHVSYVFGKVITALTKAGYKEGENLDAAAYDWRLAPSAMEERDGYFSETMKKVEELYEKNNNTPVVLVCHSLGCKVGHYFLNFCHARDKDWCDKYIHTYMAVGGPHLGAPKAIRGIVTGDKMGLDAFLSDSNALALARSFGSTPWLVPRELPPGAPPPCFMHRQGVIEVCIKQLVNVSCLFKDRKDSDLPKKLKLAVRFGKSVATTDYLPLNDEMAVSLEGNFTFATDADGPRKSQRLIVAVCEPGVSMARNKKRKKREDCCGCHVSLWIKILFCWHIIRYSIEWTLRLTAFLVYIFYWQMWVYGADLISKASGGTSVVAVGKPIQVNEFMVTEETDIAVDLLDNLPNWKCWRKKERVNIQVHVRWIPPDKRVPKDIRASIANLKHKPSSLVAVGKIESTKYKKRDIEACSGYVLLKREGLNQTLNTIERVYNSDRNEPRRYTTDMAPPVRRVKAIYGINLPTEVGAVYRRHAVAVESNVTNYCTVDTNARIASGENGYVVENGIVLETKSTTQSSLHGQTRSGDGTVPYYSMQHVRTWRDSCNVSVEELEGADHREILADERFHKILVGYVTTRNNAGAEENV